MRWLVVVAIVGCHPAQPPPPPPPTFAPAKPKPPISSTIDAGVAAVDAGAPDPARPDPPEPTAPQLECTFTRSVFCIAGTPTITALLPSPFEWCPATQPARQDSLIAGDARFSAVETRARRATQADACCYLEFSTRACR